MGGNSFVTGTRLASHFYYLQRALSSFRYWNIMPVEKMMEDVDMERGTKRAAPVDKSPVMVLEEIRPHTKYIDATDNTGGHVSTFVMNVSVDGQTYSGTGRSKKLAREKAAKAALEQHFKLEFSVTEDGIVYNMGTKKQRHNYKLFKMENKSNEVTLFTLYDGLKYIVLCEDAGRCKVRLNIEGTIIEGSGQTLKDAKEWAHHKGITFLKEMGLYDKRVKEHEARKEMKRQKKMEFFKQQKEEKAAAKLASGKENVVQKPNIPVKKAPAPPVKASPTSTTQQQMKKKKDKATKL